MSRDHRKLRVFLQADQLVMDVYKASASFPATERFGLQSQLRRSGLSVACNIVEGAARRTTAEYAHFMNIAASSAAESEYLTDVARRLGYLSEDLGSRLSREYRGVAGGLQALIRALSLEP